MQNDGSALTRQRVYCRRRSTIEEPVGLPCTHGNVLHESTADAALLVGHYDRRPNVCGRGAGAAAVRCPLLLLRCCHAACLLSARLRLRCVSRLRHACAICCNVPWRRQKSVGGVWPRWCGKQHASTTPTPPPRLGTRHARKVPSMTFPHRHRPAFPH